MILEIEASFGVPFCRLQKPQGYPSVHTSIGSRRYRAERVQFWYDEEQCVTRVLAGKNMGRWYAEGIQSEFKRKWRGEVDKECIVEFPHLFLVFNYIRQVSDNK